MPWRRRRLRRRAPPGGGGPKRRAARPGTRGRAAQRPAPRGTFFARDYIECTSAWERANLGMSACNCVRNATLSPAVAALIAALRQHTLTCAVRAGPVVGWPRRRPASALILSPTAPVAISFGPRVRLRPHVAAAVPWPLARATPPSCPFWGTRAGGSPGAGWPEWPRPRTTCKHLCMASPGTAPGVASLVIFPLYPCWPAYGCHGPTRRGS